MISAKKLTKTLIKNKVTFFSGVPDSILKNFSNYIDRFPKKKHVISVNEGSAVSLGIGYYLSTKKLPCIYLQNSFKITHYKHLILEIFLSFERNPLNCI